MGRKDSGFTLVELVVVMAIIGILAAGAVVYITPRSYAKTAPGFTREISALCDAARHRSVATRTYQRIEFQSDEVLHLQATTTGMGTPIAWETVARVAIPETVVIDSFDPVTHAIAGEDVPESGVGLPGTIDFAPDGTATPGTVFVKDTGDEGQSRATVYRATGTAYAYEDW